MPQITTSNLYHFHPELQELYQLDFLAWYVDRWGGKETDIIWSLHPEYKDHDWDGTPDPLLRVVENQTAGIWYAVQAATGVGKTWLQSLLIYWHLDVFRDSRIIAVGESEEGLRRTLWEEEVKPKFPRFKKLVPSAFSYKIMRIIGNQADDNEAEEIVNWQVRGIGVRKRSGEQSAGALQGIHAKRFFIVLDELAKIDPSVVTAAVSTASDPEFNMIAGFGNPDNQLDALYQFGDYPNVDRIIISALDFPNLVCDEKKVPGAVTWGSVKLREEKYGKTGAMYLSRVRGQSAENSDSTLLRRKVVESRVNFEATGYGNFAGVDVANSEEGDEACVCYLKGNQIAYLKPFKCPDANAIALNMVYEGDELTRRLTEDREGKPLPEPLPNYGLSTLEEYDIRDEDVAVDSIGVGVGTVNQFKQERHIVYSFVAGATVMNNEDMGHMIEYDQEDRPLLLFADVRTLAFWLTKTDFENGHLGFGPDIHPDVVKQAAKEASAYRIKKTGGSSKKLIRLEPKDSIRKRLMNRQSPNTFDAICQANFLRHFMDMGT